MKWMYWMEMEKQMQKLHSKLALPCLTTPYKCSAEGKQWCLVSFMILYLRPFARVDKHLSNLFDLNKNRKTSFNQLLQERRVERTSHDLILCNKSLSKRISDMMSSNLFNHKQHIAKYQVISLFIVVTIKFIQWSNHDCEWLK